MDTISHQKLPQTSICYCLIKNTIPMVLPIISTRYMVRIQNNFVLITSIQRYKNPFKQSVTAHYSISIDPEFVISVLTIQHKNTVIDVLSQHIKKSSKIEYPNLKLQKQNSQQKHLTQQFELCILKPQQQTTIKLQLIGSLIYQIPNKLICVIPSNIFYRYNTLIKTIENVNMYFKSQSQMQSYLSYIASHLIYYFGLQLRSSNHQTKWQCPSHQLKQTMSNDESICFTIPQRKLHQKDFYFIFQLDQPTLPLCTLGSQSIAITMLNNNQSHTSNFDTYKGQYLLILYRSATLPKLLQTIDTLILFLQSLPNQSIYNIILLQKHLQKIYQTSLPYTKNNIINTIQLLSTFSINTDDDIIQTVSVDQFISIYQFNNNYDRNIILFTESSIYDLNHVDKIGKINKYANSYELQNSLAHIGNGIYLQYKYANHNYLNPKGKQSKSNLNIQKQAIYLLDSILQSHIKNINVQDTNKIIKSVTPFHKKHKKSKPLTIFLQLSPSIAPQTLQTQTLKLSYLDKNANRLISQQLLLPQSPPLPHLHKFFINQKIQQLLQQSTQQSLSLAQQLSVKYQIILKSNTSISKKLSNDSSSSPKITNTSQSTPIQQTIKIYIRTITGKTITIPTAINQTILLLKQTITNQQQIPFDQQKLVFGGQYLQNQKYLSDYNIQKQSTLHLLLRIRGNGCNITVIIDNQQLQFQIANNSKVIQIYQQIYYRYPFLRTISFPLLTKQKPHKKLQKSNPITFYQTQSKLDLIADIPSYIFKPQRIINKMKITGEWQYNDQILKYLKIDMKSLIKSYGKNNKSMTMALIKYFKSHFNQQFQQFKYIYLKTQRFLNL